MARILKTMSASREAYARSDTLTDNWQDRTICGSAGLANERPALTTAWSPRASRARAAREPRKQVRA